MAFSMGKGPQQSMSEINVTPFVDVMLVLLIVFMISAPLMQTGVDIDLPEGSLEMEQSEDVLVLSIDGAGKHYLNETYLQPEVMLEKVQQARAASASKVVYIRADRNLPYGNVVELISRLREAGIAEVSLITLPPESKPR